MVCRDLCECIAMGMFLVRKNDSRNYRLNCLLRSLEIGFGKLCLPLSRMYEQDSTVNSTCRHVIFRLNLGAYFQGIFLGFIQGIQTSFRCDMFCCHLWCLILILTSFLPSFPPFCPTYLSFTEARRKLGNCQNTQKGTENNMKSTHVSLPIILPCLLHILAENKTLGQRDHIEDKAPALNIVDCCLIPSSTWCLVHCPEWPLSTGLGVIPKNLG